jgi:HSP20 family protein
MSYPTRRLRRPERPDPFSRHQPDIDVEEAGDGWVVEVRLPGVAPEEVFIDVSDRELQIRARHEESEQPPAAEQAPVTRRSRRYADFSYRLSIPSDVDTDAIDATMDHGLLTIRLPRAAGTRSRRITVGRRPDQSTESQPTEGQPTER